MKFFFPLVMLVCLLFSGCVQNYGTIQLDDETDAGFNKVYRGKVTNRSDAKKSFSLEVVRHGRSRIVELKFDDQTRGMDHVVNRKQVIVAYRVVAGSPVARSVKAEKAGFVAGVSEVTIKEVKKMIAQRDEFILIDSRPEDEYGKSHLPSSISIPACRMKEHDNLLPADRDQLLVFYCGGPTCGMSTQAAATAARSGYTNIKVMLDGVEGWVEAGFPTFADDQFILQGDLILIDLRPVSKDTVHKIPGSVSIPFASLQDRLRKISKKAPVVVYSDSISDSHSALGKFRSAGFRSVSMVQGNVQGWKKRNRPMISGPVVTTISWQRKPGQGEVAPDAFQQAMDGRANAVILDVRTSEETAAGSLKGATLIPMHELFERREELPTDRKIYVYSATGARADMASRQLNENGYNAYFLVADVSCSNGNCTVEY